MRAHLVSVNILFTLTKRRTKKTHCVILFVSAILKMALHVVILCWSYTIAVTGSSTSIGRELVIQSLEKGCNVLEVLGDTTSISSPIMRAVFHAPSESLVQNGRRKDQSFAENFMSLHSHDIDLNVEYDALVLCNSGRPFSKDISDIETDYILDRIPRSCDKIVLVSAFGVDEYDDRGFWTNLLKRWYLKSFFRAKKNQEQRLKEIVKQNDGQLMIGILRPPALVASRDAATIDGGRSKQIARYILGQIMS